VSENLNIKEMLAQISKYESDCEILKIHLEEASEILVKDINIFMKEKFRKDIETNAKTQSEITKKLGIEKLTELKNDLSELIERIPSLVNGTMKNDVWLHNNYSVSLENEFGQKRHIRSGFNSIITNILRELYGHAGLLLFKYEYANFKTSGWEKQYKSEIPKYKYSFSLSKQLEEAIDIYINLLEQLHDLLVKLDKVTNQKEQQEASDLWDQA